MQDQATRGKASPLVPIGTSVRAGMPVIQYAKKEAAYGARPPASARDVGSCGICNRLNISVQIDAVAGYFKFLFSFTCCHIMNDFRFSGQDTYNA